MKHKLGLCLLATVQAMGVGCTNSTSATCATIHESDAVAVGSLISREEAAFNNRDLDALQSLLTPDAIEMSPTRPDVIGSAAIRADFATAFAQVDMRIQFNTQLIEPAGNLTYEEGTYTIHSRDRKSGQAQPDSTSRYVHIFRRLPDGNWKIWRLITVRDAPAAN